MSNESPDDSQASAHIIKPKLHLIDVEEKRGRRLHLKSINSVIEPWLISCLIQNLEKKWSLIKKPCWPSVRMHVFVAGLFFKVSYSGGWVPGDFGLEPTKALYRIRTSTSKPEQGLFFNGSRMSRDTTSVLTFSSLSRLV